MQAIPPDKPLELQAGWKFLAVCTCHLMAEVVHQIASVMADVLKRCNPMTDHLPPCRLAWPQCQWKFCRKEYTFADVVVPQILKTQRLSMSVNGVFRSEA